MHKIFRKVYIGIMTTIFCCITAFTVTYAWLGLLTSSNFESFTIDIEKSNLNEYTIKLSLDGVNFSDEIDEISLRKQILINMGVPENLLTDEYAIQDKFNNIHLAQCTVKPNSDNTFSEFTDINDAITNNILKFDLYLSPEKSYESGNDSEYLMDCYLIDSLFEGTVCSYTLMNEYTYPSDYVNSKGNITAGTTISTTKIDSSYASRLAIQKYKVVEKGKPEQYSADEKPNDYIIYQGGKDYANYDTKTGIYDFGGIIETEYNLSVSYLNHCEKRKLIVPDWAINRGDICFNEENNKIIDSTNSQEQVGVNQMIKLTFYFWFEGWDPDCFNVINNKPVSLNLSFSTNYRSS